VQNTGTLGVVDRVGRVGMLNRFDLLKAVSIPPITPQEAQTATTTTTNRILKAIAIAPGCALLQPGTGCTQRSVLEELKDTAKETFQEAIKQWKSPQRTADEPAWQRAVPRPKSPHESDCRARSDEVQRERARARVKRLSLRAAIRNGIPWQSPGCR